MRWCGWLSGWLRSLACLPRVLAWLARPHPDTIHTPVHAPINPLFALAPDLADNYISLKRREKELKPKKVGWVAATREE